VIRETAEKIKKHMPFTNKADSYKLSQEDEKGLRDISMLQKESCFHNLNTCQAGLTEEAADERLKIHGPNEIVHDKAPGWYVQFLQAFVNPFIAVLIVIAVISLITDVLVVAPADRDYETIIVVSVMVFLSGFLRFWQEFRSNKAAEQLKSMVSTTASVMRDGAGKVEIDIKKLVPGDIVLLSAGSIQRPIRQ
jgi:Mg2+-importing ATPase